MRKKNFLSYVAGFLTAAALFGFCVPTLAASIQKQITATYKDIKLYVDGKEVVPKDAGGNVVEPFVSNGTTYLPVRAVGEAFGKEVTWDGTTNSVYIGEKPASETTNHRTSFSLANLKYSVDSSWGYKDDTNGRTHYTKTNIDENKSIIIVQNKKLNADVSNESAASSTLNVFMNAFTKTFQNVVPGNIEKVAGRYAQYCTFDHAVANSNVSYPCKAAFILDGTYVYTITVVTPQSEATQLDKIFSDVIASVQFSSSTESNTGNSTEKTYEERLKEVAMRSLMGEEITYSKYLQIRTGMTYIEVAEIIGDLGDITAQSGNITIRSWQNSDYGVASIVFTDGKVTSKSQVGL